LILPEFFMFEINERIRIPEEEFTWSFARSGGPGGQNVNKVASKALLAWDVSRTSCLPIEVKIRLRTLQRRRFTKAGMLQVVSQRYRDQERNRQDCLEKLREMVLEALVVPKSRKPSRPTRGAREARLRAKKIRAGIKSARRPPNEE
jgi:ribosome-associated protein